MNEKEILFLFDWSDDCCYYFKLSRRINKSDVVISFLRDVINRYKGLSLKGSFFAKWCKKIVSLGIILCHFKYRHNLKDICCHKGLYWEGNFTIWLR